ncbi:urease accessory protein UreE [Acidihalobacter aeolianus]|uniref:Urease accessory protein UreE n=1 Tax=Acidihalobacter aeolianus TaxID=2792603 RepID=A0A1D8K4V4_9GAMM|nr:urease accessory protein UreE [Acidihalobacter aeolianus]AOV15989.1 urease accessory protein UreE [Acidihalobacter aeolianus]
MSAELIRIESLAEPDAAADATLTLPFELRQRSRLRAHLDDGGEVGLFLPRGGVLRHGDRLRAADGRVVEVRAAPETVSTARAASRLDLLRAAYHLGNRHVPLQVAEDWLRYAHDHVLDDMVRGLGLEVAVEQAPFEPEAGAYGGGHGHGHQHGHPHEH